jgi:hypothetical protein
MNPDNKLWLENLLDRHGWPTLLLVILCWCLYRFASWGEPMATSVIDGHNKFLLRTSDKLESVESMVTDLHQDRFGKKVTHKEKKAEESNAEN